MNGCTNLDDAVYVLDVLGETRPRAEESYLATDRPLTQDSTLEPIMAPVDLNVTDDDRETLTENTASNTHSITQMISINSDECLVLNENTDPVTHEEPNLWFDSTAYFAETTQVVDQAQTHLSLFADTHSSTLPDPAPQAPARQMKWGEIVTKFWNVFRRQ